MNERLRVATRASKLALAQAQAIVDALAARGVACDLVPVTTKGDQIVDRSLAAIGGDGVFVKELEAALVDGRADIAVHSMKDLPTELLRGATAGVVPERGDPRDALVATTSNGGAIASLPDGAIVGTSSLRRSAQLKAIRPDLEIRDVRGNVDTRIRKLVDGRYHAIVLAMAGLDRLGSLDGDVRVSPVPLSDMIPAVGQGALFVQCRSGDEGTQRLIEPLRHETSTAAVMMERAFLKRMGGGCLVPIGAHVAVDGQSWRLDAFAAMPDGSDAVRRSAQGTLPGEAEAVAAVERIADEMLDAGAREIVARFRQGQEGAT